MIGSIFYKIHRSPMVSKIQSMLFSMILFANEETMSQNFWLGLSYSSLKSIKN